MRQGINSQNNNQRSLHNYVDNLIITTNDHYEREPTFVNDLNDIDVEEFAVKLFDQDIDRADFLVENLDEFSKELREYICEDSTDNAIELASKFKQIFLKHYEYKMNKLLDERQDLLRAYS